MNKPQLLSYDSLKDNRTYYQGQTDDCKLEIDAPCYRYWLSRMTMADGEPCEHKITIEYYDGNGWQLLVSYQGDTMQIVERSSFAKYKGWWLKEAKSSPYCKVPPRRGF